MPVASTPSPTSLLSLDVRQARRVVAVGGLVTALVTLAYLLSFWNHFVGLRSGSGEYTSGVFFVQGFLPYRDYFIPSTCLNNLKAGLILSLFGKAFIATRAMAVLERTFLGVIVYLWLARMFRASHAAIAAIVTILLGSADISDPLASYNHDAILGGVAAGFLASYALDVARSRMSIAVFAILSGFCAGLSFATKQTTGLGVSVAIPVIVCLALLTLDNLQKALIFLLSFCLGWALCAGALVVWLIHLGAFTNFVQDVFVRGPAAKAAHPADFLVREIASLKKLWWAAIAAVLALAVCWSSWIRSARQNEKRRDGMGPLLVVLLTGLASVGAGILASYLNIKFARALLKPTVYFTFFSVTLLPIFYTAVWLRRELSRRQAQFCLYAAVSFSIAFMLSLSFPAFEAMIVPGLGLLIAALLDASTAWSLPLTYAACALLIASETCAKNITPFGFADFNEPSVRTAHATSSLPEMKGFVLPEGTVRFIDGAVRIINENARPSDKIFTFPEFGYFYGITGRHCPTASCSHNIDVISDEFARSEAATLLRDRPAVLIYDRQPESLLKDEETLWRNGARSGNRDLIAAIETLAKEYRLAQTFDLPPNHYQVMVYVRQ